MERVLIISYIISMILTAGFIYCIYREKYWVFEFVNRIKKPIQQLVYVFLMLLSSYAYICFLSYIPSTPISNGNLGILYFNKA